MRVIVAGRLSRKATDRDQTGFDSQERDSVRWAEQAGHEVIAVLADFKSGRSGLESRPNLRPWVTQPDRLAQYDGIVALKVDRLTRGDRSETAKLEQWAREHGKQLMITGADVHFPSEGTDGIQWDLMLRIAHQEWLNTSERYSRMQRTLRETGSAIGRAPWGYSIEKRDGKKLFVPTAEGRRWVPLTYQAIIDGNSIRDVAAWLEAEGITALRSEKAVYRIVLNPMYYGRRKNAGQLDTEALVGHSVWQAANAALASRAKPGRSTVVRPKALLSPVCGNPDCDASGAHPSPMYRQFSKPGHPYYRCNGRGPRAHGCGNMIPAGELDAEVIDTMRADENFRTDRVFIAGDDRSDEIGRLREAAADAYRKGDKAAFRELDAQADELESLPSVAPHWQEHATCDSCGQVTIDEAWQCWANGHHVLTRGEHFASLDTDGQRAELTRYVVIGSKLDDGTVSAGIVPRNWP